MIFMLGQEFNLFNIVCSRQRNPLVQVFAARALQIQLPFHFRICFNQNLEAAVQQEGTWTTRVWDIGSIHQQICRNIRKWTWTTSSPNVQRNPIKYVCPKKSRGQPEGCSPTFRRCGLFAMFAKLHFEIICTCWLFANGPGIDTQCPLHTITYHDVSLHWYWMRLREEICNHGLALVLLQRWWAASQTHTSRVYITPNLWKLPKKSHRCCRILGMFGCLPSRLVASCELTIQSTLAVVWPCGAPEMWNCFLPKEYVKMVAVLGGYEYHSV